MSETYLDEAWRKSQSANSEHYRETPGGRVPLPTLVLTVGLPRSGKTSWARQEGCPVVSPDAIRLAVHGMRYVAAAEDYVWLVARHMVNALFLAGHERVIVDATNNTRERRDWWRSSRWRLAFRNFETSAEDCMRRAVEAEDGEIVPVIQRMAAAREPLSEFERDLCEED